MSGKIRQLLRTPFGKYLLIGGLVYLFELIVIIVAQSFGTGSLVAVGLGFWLGLILSFILTKFVTFGDKRTHRRILVPQIVAVSILVLFNFGFTLLVTDLLSELLPPTITRTLALGITTFWNFYLYRTRIFKNDAPIVD